MVKNILILKVFMIRRVKLQLIIIIVYCWFAGLTKIWPLDG